MRQSCLNWIVTFLGQRVVWAKLFRLNSSPVDYTFAHSSHLRNRMQKKPSFASLTRRLVSYYDTKRGKLKHKYGGHQHVVVLHDYIGRSLSWCRVPSGHIPSLVITLDRTKLSHFFVAETADKFRFCSLADISHSREHDCRFYARQLRWLLFFCHLVLLLRDTENITHHSTLLSYILLFPPVLMCFLLSVSLNFLVTE